MTETAAILPPQNAACLGCGYSLRGLTRWNCPECGREFDPEVLTSMFVPDRPRTPTAVDLRLLKPAWLPHRPIRLTLIVLALPSAWLPPGNLLPLAAVVTVWLGVALPYLSMKLARRSVVHRCGLAREWLHVDHAGLWRMRRLFLLALIVAVTNLPFFVTFALSRPFLARAAWHWMAEVPAAMHPPDGPTVHGLFFVKSTYASMTDVTFDVPGGDIVMRVNARGDGIELDLLRTWSW